MKDDFSNDKENKKWLPDEGIHELEVVSMIEGTSKSGNSKYTLNLASSSNANDTLVIDITNIPGKRWLLRQLIEACGIEPIEEEGHKIYDWEVSDITGRNVKAKIVHDRTPFIGRDGKEVTIPKAKIAGFLSL